MQGMNECATRLSYGIMDKECEIAIVAKYSCIEVRRASVWRLQISVVKYEYYDFNSFMQAR